MVQDQRQVWMPVRDDGHQTEVVREDGHDVEAEASTRQHAEAIGDVTTQEPVRIGFGVDQVAYPPETRLGPRIGASIRARPNSGSRSVGEYVR